MLSFVVLGTNCSQFFIVETLLTICKQCFPSMKDFTFTLTVWCVIKKKKYIIYVLCYKFNVLIHFIVFFDCRCCYHHDNDDFTTHVLLLKHFWPWLNNVLHQNEGLHNDGDQKKRNEEPMIVKMSRRTPASPRDGTSLCWPLTTTATKKWGKKRSQLFFQRHIEPLYWLYSTYQNCRPFWNLWHTIHWKKSHILHCKQRQFVVGAINSGVNLDVSLLQLLDRVNNGLH